jgi:flagellar FliJ protein
MKRFQFRLQKLLDIREAREKEVKAELAHLMKIQNEERARQESLRRGIDAQRRDFGVKFLEGKYTPGEAILFERFVDVSYRAIQSAEERIQAMEPEIEKVRVRLVEASRAKKVVEKLRERKLEEYNYEMNREIAKENDDTNQKMYTNKMTAAAGEA